MAGITIKMGKRGTLVLPSKLRKQFGLTDGSLLSAEIKDGEIRIRPSFVYEPEVWSDETRAYFILINSVTREEYDRGLPDVLAMGIDPTKIKGLPPDYRDSLPTDEEWDARMQKSVAEFGQEKLRA
ncbi:MAG: AbrB/MazE/SpoVT family DNA-binding domain-containing protein [Acidobacteriota bacterium]